MTAEGLQELKDEHVKLVEAKRPAITKRIKAAREMGDISENSEYDAARQEQAFVEGRISELEEIIKNAKVNKNLGKSEVGVGCKVTVHVDGGEEIFHIVGAPEADPVKMKISHESPLGASLLGKIVGDKFEVDAPVGQLTYTVLKIE